MNGLQEDAALKGYLKTLLYLYVNPATDCAIAP